MKNFIGKAAWLVVMFSLLNLMACQTSSEQPADCIPGESQACTCADGQAGALVCSADGFFAPCARDNVRCVAANIGQDVTGEDGTVTGDGTSVGDGTTAQDVIPDVPPGPTVACPYPYYFGKATVEEDLSGGAAQTTMNLSFYGDGALLDIDGQTCTVGASNLTATRCEQTYDCGGACSMVFSQYLADGRWNLVPTTPGSGCTKWDAFYRVCTSDCSGKQCGDDGCGGLCGLCPYACENFACVDNRTPCDKCISNCLEYDPATRPNCCTCGPSCFCGSECASMCSP